MINWKIKIKNVAKPIFRIFTTLISIFLFIWLFRYLGFKGILGLFIGMTIMAYLILSKNMLLLGIVNIFDAGGFVEEINKKEK